MALHQIRPSAARGDVRTDDARKIVAVILLWLFGLVPLGTEAAQRDYVIGPQAQWVIPHTPHLTADVPTEQNSKGLSYLLVDSQTRVEARDKVSYRHYVTKALNERGVETAGNIEISFNPAFEVLTLHAINIHREGKLISKLPSSTIRILQREKDLDYQIFDGTKTAHVFLDDVRVGDVVEYSFSVRGTNPVFANHQFGQIDLQWSVPVKSLYTRLLLPTGREFKVVTRNTTAPLTILNTNGYRDYRWEATSQPALEVDRDAPGWFDPYPAMQWSEFADWESIARWAQPYYRVPTSLNPALRAEVERIANSTNDPSERVLAVLQFVQREIRYLGVEIGPASHSPSPPELVLKRRFGDCKDKALLTVTLLNALGIDARPALTNTNLRRGIQQLQPTPGAFNHVIVHTMIGGNEYWLDPTRSTQKGTLREIFQPNYGYALVIDAKTRNLSEMSYSRANTLSRSVHVIFDASRGVGQPVDFKVQTSHIGASAETLRDTLRSTTVDSLQKQYLNFYAQYYPNLRVAQAVIVEDAANKGYISTTEHYVIDDFWQQSEQKQRQEAHIRAPDLESYMNGPDKLIRLSPLRISYPADLNHLTELRLPSNWKIKTGTETVEDPAFRFYRVTTIEGNTVFFKDRFRSKTDEISASDTARYASNLKQARNILNFTIWQNNETSVKAGSILERINWPIAMSATLLLLVCIWWAVHIYRWDPPLAAPAVVNPKHQGLRGWLIVAAIGITITPLQFLNHLYRLLPSYTVDAWAYLTVVGSSGYHVLWAPSLIFALATDLALTVLSILLIALFFRKRRSTPRIYIVLVISSLVVAIITLLLTSANTNATQQDNGQAVASLLLGIVSTIIWCTYFLRSKRVKATFVNTYCGTNRAVTGETLTETAEA